MKQLANVIALFAVGCGNPEPTGNTEARCVTAAGLRVATSVAKDPDSVVAQVHLESEGKTIVELSANGIGKARGEYGDTEYTLFFHYAWTLGIRRNGALIAWLETNPTVDTSTSPGTKQTVEIVVRSCDVAINCSDSDPPGESRCACALDEARDPRVQTATATFEQIDKYRSSLKATSEEMTLNIELTRGAIHSATCE